MLASASADVDVAVLGAGAAGLAAAAALREAGLRVALLEGGMRIGGRAWTDRPAVLGGARFDHGAQWLHAAHRNPLIALARAKGVAVQPDTPWDDRSLAMDRPATRPTMTHTPMRKRAGMSAFGQNSAARTSAWPLQPESSRTIRGRPPSRPGRALLLRLVTPMCSACTTGTPTRWTARITWRPKALAR